MYQVTTPPQPLEDLYHSSCVIKYSLLLTTVQVHPLLTLDEDEMRICFTLDLHVKTN